MAMRALSVIPSLVLTLALVGCGGDEEPTTEPTESEATSSTPADEETSTPAETAAGETPEQELEASYRAYVKAFLSGDGATAYEMLSQRCKDTTPLSEFASGSETAAELYGLVEYEITSVTVDGNEGRVSADFPVKALQGGDPRGSAWLLEDGEWRSDKCGD